MSSPGNDLRQRYAEALANAECEKQPRCVDCMADAVMAVRDGELERLREERDQAIAHDRQPYPTAWAYEQACKALHSWRERAETAEAKLAEVEDAITWGVSCTRHAELLTECRRQEERAEQAEAVVARVREVATAWRDDAMKRADVRPVTPDHATWAAVAHVCALVLAALDDTPEAEHG